MYKRYRLSLSKKIFDRFGELPLASCFDCFGSTLHIYAFHLPRRTVQYSGKGGYLDEGTEYSNHALSSAAPSGREEGILKEQSRFPNQD
jgi:hypothetical protein